MLREAGDREKEHGIKGKVSSFKSRSEGHTEVTFQQKLKGDWNHRSMWKREFREFYVPLIWFLKDRLRKHKERQILRMGYLHILPWLVSSFNLYVTSSKTPSLGYPNSDPFPKPHLSKDLPSFKSRITIRIMFHAFFFLSSLRYKDIFSKTKDLFCLITRVTTVPNNVWHKLCAKSVFWCKTNYFYKTILNDIKLFMLNYWMKKNKLHTEYLL